MSTDLRDVSVALCEAIDEQYFDPTYSGLDWPAVRGSYLQSADSVSTSAELVELTSEMLARFGVSHLALVQPEDERPIGLALRAHEIEGQRIVTWVASGSDAERRGVRPGDRLLTDEDRLMGPLGSTVEVLLEDSQGESRTLVVRREMTEHPPERPALRWQVLRRDRDNRIGVLRVTHFDAVDSRDVDRAMVDLLDTRALIVDVRDNPGGDISCIYLASYFAGRRDLVGGLVTRPYLSAVDSGARIDLAGLPDVTGTDTIERAFEQLGPVGAVSLWTSELDRHYEGRVAVLANEGTGSAAEGFVAYFDQRTDIPVVGRPTAGALLSSFVFGLPGGWQLRLPTGALVTPDGKIFKDSAVVPTHEVGWTRADVCDSRDPDMARALELIDSA